MSKSKETTETELPKNPQEYSYRGDEKLETPASLFMASYRANDAALKQGIHRIYPTRTEWISTLTKMVVEDPTEEAKASGEVRESISLAKTFSPENVFEYFEEWLVADIIPVKEALIQQHNGAVQDGKATLISELKQRAAENIVKNQESAKAEVKANIAEEKTKEEVTTSGSKK